MDRLDESLAYAQQACERFPFVPRLWWERARLHNVRGELPDAITALEQALAINPAYGHAARFLAELHEKAGDLKRARQVIELAIAHAPLDAFAHANLAEVLWKSGENEKALERLQQALRLEPGHAWGWSALADWTAKLNRPESAVQFARDLTERRPGEARSWLVLAECLADRHDLESIAVVDRAIQLNPWNDAAYDLKAFILGRFDRFDEALACCRPAALPAPTPLLRMREAWIEAQRGRLALAVARITEVLAEQPANYGGWKSLSEWETQLGNLQKAADAADQMARLAPHDPVPLGYAADLLLRKGDRPGALARFRRAFQLNPQYAFAGLHIFDLLFEDNDLSGAAAVLATLKKHADDEYLAVREARLALREDRLQEALDIFSRLCRWQAEHSWSLFSTADALTSAGQWQALEKLVAQALAEEAPNPHLGALWIRLCFEKFRFNPVPLLHKIARRGGLGRNSLWQYLDLAACTYDESYEKNDLTTLATSLRLRYRLRGLLRQYRDLLAGDDQLWGKVGYVLATMGRFSRAAEWLADWQGRKGVESWMLYNLVLSLGAMGRPAAARQIIHHALGLRQDSALFDSFAVLGALEEALQGRAAQARDLVAAVRSEKMSDFDKAVRGFTQAILLAGESAASNRWELTKKLRTHLLECLSGFLPYHHHRLVRRAYWRCLRRLAEVHGLKLLRWWGVWHYLKFGWFGVVLSPVLVPFLLLIGPFGWVLLWLGWARLRRR
jgi:tetratricopeptide (TPR) repeat protein